MNTLTVEPPKIANHAADRHRSLFWKEWSESSRLIGWSALLTTALFVAAVTLAKINTPDVKDFLDRDTSIQVLLFSWCISLAFIGASTFSQEIGSGTLTFLSSLPVSRKTLWWTKTIVSLASQAVTILAAFTIYILVVVLAHRTGIMFANLRDNLMEFRREIPQLSSLIVGLIALSSITSVLFDKTLSALMTTIVVFISLIGLGVPVIGQADNFLPNNLIIMAAAVYIAVITLLFGNSYEIFVHGETLKTTKRIVIFFRTAAVDTAVIVFTLIIAIIWLAN